jgi:hypothetical protein
VGLVVLVIGLALLLERFLRLLLLFFFGDLPEDPSPA